MQAPKHSGTLPAENATVHLPPELYYPICAYVTSRRDLCTIAATARVFQKPAEAVLHRKIVLASKEAGRAFINILKECPRFAPLVRELHLDRSPENQRTEDGGYWLSIRDTLSRLPGLETLIIGDGTDASLSWILSALPENTLKVLRCAFLLDHEFLISLRRQSNLEDLSWTGSLLSLLSSSPDFKTVHHDETPHPSGGKRTGVKSDFDPDEPLVRIFRNYLPPTSLPRIKHLHSESVAFARALVPGRAITHLWVPGASFTIAVSSDYTYRHIIFPAARGVDPPTIDPLSAGAEHGHAESPIQLAAPRLNLSSDNESAYLCRAIHDFGLSRGPVYSLRMALDLPHSTLSNVLACISQELPSIRALGFLPASVLDYDNTGTRLSSETSSVPLLPYFRSLHTVCLWSIPSRRAIHALEASPNVPALRAFACLHFSPAFEWLCIPVNDDKASVSKARHGGIQWKLDMDLNDNTRRRVTAIHDPENMLWRYA